MTKLKERHQSRVRRGYSGNYTEGGFTLVELMVVVSIVAVLAVVATPAYINYIHRTNQGQAVSLLLNAQAEMEEYLADNGANQYAPSIECLPSFIPSGATGQACLANCNCANSFTPTGQYYTFSVAAVSTNYYRILATRNMGSTVDRLTISATTNTPVILTPNALKWSIFSWLFQ